MIKLDIKSELPQAAKWTNEHTKQLPFSIAQALTATSKGITQIPESKSKNIIADYKRIINSKLDRPTRAYRMASLLLQLIKGHYVHKYHQRVHTRVKDGIEVDIL